MGLFKKKAKQESCCCCDEKCEHAIENENAWIKILGSGCAKCKQLEAATKQALVQLGMDEDVEHVTDFARIAQYGVMSTPALVIDGKVVSYGKVLKTDEIVKILKETTKHIV